VLRAPRAAGASDLVAVFDERFLVIGTSREAAERLAGLLQISAPGPADHEIRLFLDGVRLRALPAVTLALRGVDDVSRSWLGAVRTLRILLRFRKETIDGYADMTIDGP
jgi:hypothetical protein